MPRPSMFDSPKKQGVIAAADAGSVEYVTGEASPLAKPKKEVVKTTLYLAPAVHDLLREVAFHERKKVHDLIIEGVDAVLKNRRHPSVAEVAGKA